MSVGKYERMRGQQCGVRVVDLSKMETNPSAERVGLSRNQASRIGRGFSRETEERGGVGEGRREMKRTNKFKGKDSPELPRARFKSPQN